HDAAPGGRLRRRHRRAPRGLAHAAAPVARRPRTPGGRAGRATRRGRRGVLPGVRRPHRTLRNGEALRIGIVSPYSWDVPGGVQFHIRDLAEHLIRLGHEVSVLAPADDETPLPPY